MGCVMLCEVPRNGVGVMMTWWAKRGDDMKVEGSNGQGWAGAGWQCGERRRWKGQWDV